MAKQFTFTQERFEANTVNYTATADIAVGDVVPLGTSAVGIARVAIANGDAGSLGVEGQGDVVAETGVAWTIGDVIYWDATNKKGTKTSTSNARLGIAIAAKASATAVGRVALNYTF